MFIRTFVAALLVLGVVATSPAQAHVLSSTREMSGPQPSDTLAAWLGRSTPSLFLPSSSPADAAAGVSNRVLVTLHPLGDVTHDGKADVLMEAFDLQSRTATYQALSGAGLQEALWSVQGQKDRVLGSMADLDGDGILDPLMVTVASASGSISHTAAGPAFAESGQITSNLAFTPFQGTTGVQRFQATLTQQLDVTSASSQLGDVLGNSQNKTSQQVGQIQGAGKALFASFQDTWNTTRSSATLPVQPAKSTTVDADAVVRLLDLQGQVKSTIMLQEPNVNPLEIATNDLLRDGSTQVLVLSLAKVGQNQELPAGVPRVQAFSATGQALWTATLDALAGTPMLVSSLGDVDGDGKVDLGVLELKVGADVRSTDSRFVLLSGVDGATKATLSRPGAVLGIVPLGRSGVAKGDMVLGVAENNTNKAIELTAMAGAQLKTVWDLPLSPGTVPLNMVTDPLTGNLQGFTDLTRDGVPDVLTGLGGPVQPGFAHGLEMTLYSGVDGKVVWTRHIADVAAATILSNAGTAASSVNNATAAAQGATAPATSGILAVLTMEGPEAQVQAGLDANASLVLKTYGLADGAPMWQMPIVTAEKAAKLSSKLALVSSVAPLGDIDGDGQVDMEVRVEHRLDGNLTGPTVARAQGMALDASNQTVAHTHVVSGATGKVIWSHSDELAAGTPRVPLPEPGELKAKSLFATVDTDAKKSPTPAMGALVALAVCVLALRRPRRN